MVSEKETHCVCAAAIVLQQATAIEASNAGALPLLHNKKHDGAGWDQRESVRPAFDMQELRVLLHISMLVRSPGRFLISLRQRSY